MAAGDVEPLAARHRETARQREFDGFAGSDAGFAGWRVKFEPPQDVVLELNSTRPMLSPLGSA